MAVRRVKKTAAEEAAEKKTAAKKLDVTPGLTTYIKQLFPPTTKTTTVTSPTTASSVGWTFGEAFGKIGMAVGDIAMGMGAQAAPSGGGGGGGRSGGGGGGGSAAPSATVRGWFQWWYGSTPAGLISQADKLGWTEQDVINLALKNGVAGPGLIEQRDVIRGLAAGWYEGDPTAIPASLINGIIKQGLWQDPAYLKNVYFPKLWGIGATTPAAQPYIEYYTQATGRIPSADALVQLNKTLKDYGGLSDTTLAAWRLWVNGTEAAITGNYGAGKRVAIDNTFRSILGREATPEELVAPSRAPVTPTPTPTQPTTRPTLKSGATGDDVKALQTALNAAGYSPPLTVDGSFGGKTVTALKWYQSKNGLTADGVAGAGTWAKLEPPTAPGATLPTPPVTPDKTLWNLSQEALLEYVRGTTEYRTLYAGKPDWMAENEYIARAQAFDLVMKNHYGIHATVNPDGSISIPTDDTPGDATNNPLNRFGLIYVNPQMVNTFLGSNYTPEQLAREFEIEENAEANKGTYESILQEAFDITFTDDEWYNLSSGGIGSGALRAKLTEAQNRVAFREAFRTYTGDDPTPGDYDYLSDTFVSPSEYAKRMQAKQSAVAMLPSVNKALEAVFGHATTQEELENLAMGGEGSGALQAEIDQASKLYAMKGTWAEYHAGANPSTDDYATMAGYENANELRFELALQQELNSLTPEIQQTWAFSHNGEQLDAEQIRTLVSGDISEPDFQRQYAEAKKTREKYLTAVLGAHAAGKIGSTYQIGPTGGLQAGVPSLPDLA